MEDAVEVHIEHATPLLACQITCVTADDNTSIIEQVVEMSIGRDGFVDELLDFFLRSDINMRRVGSPATLRDGSGNLPRASVIDIGDNDQRASARQFLA